MGQGHGAAGANLGTVCRRSERKRRVPLTERLGRPPQAVQGLGLPAVGVEQIVPQLLFVRVLSVKRVEDGQRLVEVGQALLGLGGDDRPIDHPPPHQEEGIRLVQHAEPSGHSLVVRQLGRQPLAQVKRRPEVLLRLREAPEVAEGIGQRNMGDDEVGPVRADSRVSRNELHQDAMRLLPGGQVLLEPVGLVEHVSEVVVTGRELPVRTTKVMEAPTG